jgi:hypothetical protein
MKNLRRLIIIYFLLIFSFINCSVWCENARRGEKRPWKRRENFFAVKKLPRARCFIKKQAHKEAFILFSYPMFSFASPLCTLRYGNERIDFLLFSILSSQNGNKKRFDLEKSLEKKVSDEY